MNTINKYFKIVPHEVPGIGTIYHVHRADFVFGILGEYKRVSPDAFFSKEAAEKDLERHEVYYLYAAVID